MKNKLKKTMTALCAALILMGGFSQSVHSIVSQLLFRSPRSPVLLRLAAILFLWDSA